MVTMIRELERGLIQAGLPAERATAIAESFEARIADVASKEDVERVVTEFRRELEVVRNEMQLEMRMRSDVVDERFKSVDKRFDQVDKRFDQVDKRFAEIIDRLTMLEERVIRLITVQIGVIAALVAGLISAIIYAVVG